ncbi:hypothetical protein F2Q70_00021232 [Brassica cretica]|uniref:non-specific serine/threonine protein kinase n=1 Tax=Brassica cretica TaxID=69181 RepID=A0A8S9GI33_BRACR|nr:hypothetical protein F2Q70_00021232 [Brassica cretica]
MVSSNMLNVGSDCLVILSWPWFEGCLGQIAKTLGSKFWKFDAENCKVETVGLTETPPPTAKQEIECECSPTNETDCHIIKIAFKDHNLPGTLPPEIQKLPYLQEIDFAYNYLNGTIPLEWTMTNLTTISLLVNRLSGPIPKEVGDMTSLTSLDLESNAFTGTIPEELGNLANLEKLLLSSNKLTGGLPDSLAKLEKLEDFRINDLQLTGRIPSYIQNWKGLKRLFNNNTICHITELVLRNFTLEGKLPPDLAKLRYLQSIDLSANYLTGTIPVEWASMSHLILISLSGNSLSGTLPTWLQNLKNLKFLGLEGNQFSGHIPDELGNLTNLERLYLSSNQFTGSLPITLAKLVNLERFWICDNNLSGTFPAYMGNWSQLKRLRISDTTGIDSFPILSSKAIETLILRNLNLSGPIPSYIWSWPNLRRLDLSFNKLTGEVQDIHKAPKFTYLAGNMLTGNFESAFLFNSKPNITGLLPCAGPITCKSSRKKICVGIAKGLEFLHEGSMIRMVHRDIKTSNVLLDADLNAKISDFGLARLHEEEHTHISTKVAGTMGYMAPEYVLWGQLTEKVDVYSFGVVVVEIVSGQSNTKHKGSDDDQVSLINWALTLQQKGDILEIVDPMLEGDFNSKEAVRMINVALVCTNSSPSMRPTMSEAVQMLEGVIEIKEVMPDSGLYGHDWSMSKLMHIDTRGRSSTSGVTDQTETSMKSSVSGFDLYQYPSSSLECP